MAVEKVDQMPPPKVGMLVGAVIIGAMTLAACSSGGPIRSSLDAPREQASFAANSGGPGGVLGYSDNSLGAHGASLQPPPYDSGSQPARPTRPRLPGVERGRAPPLRQFAAMARHKPHAPHVYQNEAACLRTGLVRTTQFIRPRSPIGGGRCYVGRPFSVSAAAGGRIKLKPAATMRCQMIPSFETWVKDVLRPAARHYLGSDIARLTIAASYACRTRNSRSGAKLSEHGKANAIDIKKFHLANGRTITVKRGWRGREKTRRFLRYVHRGACEHFSTVLGPNADRYHHDHFHFDLASHGRRGTYRVCR